MDSVSENLRRAQEAIARARALSTQLSSLCLQQGAASEAAAAAVSEEGEPAAGPHASSATATNSEGHLPAPEDVRELADWYRNNLEDEMVGSVEAGRDAGASANTRAAGGGGDVSSARPSSGQEGAGASGRWELETVAEGDEDEDEEKEEPCSISAGLSSLSGPVLAVAQQLASLQRKQSETLQQLLLLRMQQLKLRQQQLTALQELLTAEMGAIEGTPLQVSAVDQAVGLLSQSLRDMKAASRAMLFSKPEDVQTVSAAVSATDLRADEVSRMARQLLGVLRAFPRRGGSQDADAVHGAKESTIANLPSLTCAAASPLCGQTCCICLGAFEEGDQLKSIECIHYHHAACLDEWLAIKACCPLCKAVLHDPIA